MTRLGTRWPGSGCEGPADEAAPQPCDLEHARRRAEAFQRVRQQVVAPHARPADPWSKRLPWMVGWAPGPVHADPR